MSSDVNAGLKGKEARIGADPVETTAVAQGEVIRLWHRR